MKPDIEERFSSRRFARARFAGRLLVSLGLLYLIMRTVPFADVINVLRKSHVFLLLIAAFLLIGRTPLMAWRWQILLSVKGYPCTLGLLTRHYFLGFFFNNFLPTSVGGDVMRAVGVSRHGVPGKTSVSSIALERLLGVLALMIIGAISFFLLPGATITRLSVIKGIGYTLAVSSLLALLIFIVSFYLHNFLLNRPRSSSKFLEYIMKGTDELLSYWDDFYILNKVLALTVISQLSAVITMYFIALSLEISIPILYFSFLLPVVWLATMLPVSISGLGVREGAFVYLFGLIGMDNQTAIAISAIWLALTYVLSIIGGVLLWSQSYEKSE